MKTGWIYEYESWSDVRAKELIETSTTIMRNAFRLKRMFTYVYTDIDMYT